MLENLVHMSSLLSIRGSRLVNAFLISSEQLGVNIDALADRKRLLTKIFKRFIPDAIGKIRKIEMEPQQVKVTNRNLKRCPNACKYTLCHRHSRHRSCVLKNRDLNAAKNIALLGKIQFVGNTDRPDAFKRATRRRARRNPDLGGRLGTV